MKALVIYHPSAGKGTSQEALGELFKKHFAASGNEFEIQEMRKDDDPSAIVRKRRQEGFDFVVAAGGDGTVSAVSDGLHGSTIPLGILPIGTGNMIAREFNIPTEVEDAVKLIAGTPRSMKIDVMKIGERVYVLSAGVGINAAVIKGTTRNSKRRFGSVAYAMTALTLFRYRPRSLDVTIDGKTEQYRAVEVAISNCGVLAKVLYPQGPAIRADDGHLDVCILSMKSPIDYVRYFAKNFFGRRGDAEFFTARESVRITTRVPLTAQADGDVIGTTPIEIELLPAALTVLVPEPAPESSAA